MKKIFIIVSAPPTIPAKVIGLFTKNRYNHVSICLEKNLEHFYSFGRLYRYFFYPGGYINEGWNKGCFLYYPKTPMVVLELPVTDAQLNIIKKRLEPFEASPKKYKYDFGNIITQMVNRERKHKNPYRFTCASFVYYILKEKVCINKHDTLVKPADFLNLDLNIIYKGAAENYGKFFEQQ